MDTLCTTNPERICEKYRGFVHCVINSHFPGYRYDDDFFQEAWIGLWEASQKYDESRGVPFQGFAAVVIKRRCYKELRRRSRQWKLPAVSVDTYISNTNLTYMDILPDREDMVGAAIDEMFTEQLLDTVQKSGLSETQLSIMEHRLQGLTLKQISQNVGICTCKVSENIRIVKQAFINSLAEIN